MFFIYIYEQLTTFQHLEQIVILLEVQWPHIISQRSQDANYRWATMHAELFHTIGKSLTPYKPFTRTQYISRIFVTIIKNWVPKKKDYFLGVFSYSRKNMTSKHKQNKQKTRQTKKEKHMLQQCLVLR